MPTDLTADELNLRVRRYFKERVAGEWGIRVDERMRTLGIREADLARLAGTTPQTISKVRKGQIVPREYLRIAIAMALGADPAVMFPLPSRERLLSEAAA